LFGKVGPSGRLTATFPRSVGQVPFYYNHFNTGRPGFGEYKGNYVDIPTIPLYPFGFGLDYTTFDFGNAQLDTNQIPLNGSLTMQAQIKNSGKRAGTTVAQLYIRALAASAGPRPVRELKGFQKIPLEPGESRLVTFHLSARELGYYDAQGHWLVEPGKYQVWISQDSASGEPAAFALVK
jgi:beta-glucosidase